MYKTILVHVDNRPAMAARVSVAIQLARRMQGGLKGLAATGIARSTYAVMSSSLGAPLPAPAYEQLVGTARAALKRFRQQADEGGVFHVEELLAEDDIARALLAASPYADLIVLSQEPAGKEREPWLATLPERIVLHAGRPLLVVPEPWHGGHVGTRIVVGWNASHAAMRAVQAALPLMREAREVTIACIGELKGITDPDPAGSLQTFLQRHGVTAKCVRLPNETEVADSLAQLAHQHNADLLVTGAYGRLRLLERIAGGTTRRVLAHSTVPVLVAY